MSIFDRAKKQLENRFKGVGEETIRVMDAVNEEPEEKARKPKPPAVPKSKPMEVPTEKEKFNLKNKIFSRPNEHEESSPTRAKKPEPQNDAFDYEESAENEYFENMDKKYKAKMKAYENVPVPLVDEGKVQDILKLLQIPPTFEIDSDIYLPDDLTDIAFDVQVPQGYEMSEVDTFVSRARISITKLVELLTLRNEHIAKLATVVDRLQVDVSNMKLESEAANGINIMPTHDTEDIEQENLELKALNKRLQEQLESGSFPDDALTSKERELFEQLQDDMSLKDLKISELSEQLYNAKTELSMLQEEQDDESDFPQEAFTSYRDEHYEESNALPDLSNGSSELPEIGYEESEDVSELPDLDTSETRTAPSNYANSPVSNSVFEDEEESIEEFLMRNQSYYQANDNDEQSSISLLDDNGSAYESEGVGTFFDDDEEDEEFEKLQNWGNR